MSPRLLASLARLPPCLLALFFAPLAREPPSLLAPGPSAPSFFAPLAREPPSLLARGPSAPVSPRRSGRKPALRQTAPHLKSCTPERRPPNKEQTGKFCTKVWPCGPPIPPTERLREAVPRSTPWVAPFAGGASFCVGWLAGCPPACLHGCPPLFLGPLLGDGGGC